MDALKEYLIHTLAKALIASHLIASTLMVLVELGEF